MTAPSRTRERLARVGGLVIVAVLGAGLAMTIDQVHDGRAEDAARADRLARMLRDLPTPTAAPAATPDPAVTIALDGLRDRVAALAGYSVTVPAPRVVITTTTAPYPYPYAARAGARGPAGPPGPTPPGPTLPAPTASPTPTTEPCRLRVPLLGLCLDREDGL